MSAVVIVAFGLPLTVAVMAAVDPRSVATRAGRRYVDHRVRLLLGAPGRSAQLATRVSRWTVRHRRVLWLAAGSYWLATLAVLAEVVVC